MAEIFKHARAGGPGEHSPPEADVRTNEQLKLTPKDPKIYLHKFIQHLSPVDLDFLFLNNAVY